MIRSIKRLEVPVVLKTVLSKILEITKSVFASVCGCWFLVFDCIETLFVCVFFFILNIHMIYCLEFHLCIGSILIPSFGITLRLVIAPVHGSQVSTHFSYWGILVNSLPKLMLLKTNRSFSSWYILLLNNLTTVFWWRRRQLTLKLRRFCIIN